MCAVTDPRASHGTGRAGNPGAGEDPFEGRAALVTGASRGAGRGIARGFGELGYTVYVTGRTVSPAATWWKPALTCSTGTPVSRDQPSR